MAQKRINKTKEEAYQILINTKDKKSFDHHDAVSLCQCKCGKIFGVINNYLRRGQVSCGCATMSKMERKVADLLTKKGLIFKQEVSFSDLKSLKGNLLRFDFIVYNKNNKIICAIETDGEQHFHRVPHFQKTIMEFKQTQEWDRRKNAYCLRKKIPLIRVPYWDYDNLTFESLFTNPAYRVVNKYHNDLLNRG